MKNQIIVFIFLLTSVIVKSQIKEQPICTKGKDIIVISGVVLDQENIPLPGVVVALVGSSTGVYTDFDGKFSISAYKNQFLEFSYVGYKTQKIKIEEKKNLLVQLVEQEKLIGCMFSAPISYSTKDNHPYKIYTVKNINFATQQDVYNAIRAKVPNVQITNTQLQETPRITMRGDDNTIVIIDGIRTTVAALHALNPADIETIKVSNNPAAVNYLRTTNN